MPDFNYEKSCPSKGLIFGIDEAGRGPWCGPVVAACVCWPNFQIDSKLANAINDSKKLSATKRELLFPQIMNSGAYIGIGQASAEEIDQLNILQATFLAMRRSLQDAEQKGHRADFALIDGNRLPKWEIPCQCLIKGDSLSLSIAAASIIAKVTRDHIMQELSKEYPQYGWHKNAGYGTKDHINALNKYGITPHHRKTYKPIANLLNNQK
ncbi:MAG: ribonuclease HII [Alphaproteobacteria bacterium]|nr:ribonuclease HII [Alphaproteobacteria bacterium]